MDLVRNPFASPEDYVPMLSKENRETILDMHRAGIGPTEIAAKLDIGRSTVYRVLKDGQCVQAASPDQAAANNASPKSGEPPSQLADAMKRAELRTVLEQMAEVASDEARYGSSSAHQAFAATLGAVLKHVDTAPVAELEGAIDDLSGRFCALALGSGPVAASRAWDGLVESIRELEREKDVSLADLIQVVAEDPLLIPAVLDAEKRLAEVESEVMGLRRQRAGLTKEVTRLRSHSGASSSQLGNLHAQRDQLVQEMNWLAWLKSFYYQDLQQLRSKKAALVAEAGRFGGASPDGAIEPGRGAGPPWPDWGGPGKAKP